MCCISGDQVLVDHFRNQLLNEKAVKLGLSMITTGETFQAICQYAAEKYMSK